MMKISFEEVADFVRSWARLPKKIVITPDTRFEQDLGVTGDDGSELLEAATKHFRVKLASEDYGYRESFNLGPDEYLFHSEGWGMAFEVLSLFHTPTVREFRVGDLHEAINRLQAIHKS
jgi:acyl carrier protein